MKSGKPMKPEYKGPAPKPNRYQYCIRRVCIRFFVVAHVCEMVRGGSSGSGRVGVGMVVGVIATVVFTLTVVLVLAVALALAWA